MFWPSKPRYSSLDYKMTRQLFRLRDDQDVYIRLRGRVKARVRVIASRVTPESCAGWQYAGIDAFIATGSAVTLYYWWELAERFNDAFICDDAQQAERERRDQHNRLAILPSNHAHGVEVYKNCTHLHIITMQFSRDAIKKNCPEPHELYNLDMYFVDVLEWPDRDQEPQILASGSAKFGLLDCPFVIPVDHVSNMKSFEYKG